MPRILELFDLPTGITSDETSRLQDPYSLRCAPHVIGVLRDTISWSSEWITTEMNSSCDNPLFDPETGQVHHGGNFYAGHVGHAMESLKLAISNVADMMERQIQLIIDEKYSRGLTPNLTARREPRLGSDGLMQGFKSLQIVATAITVEILHLANPIMVFSRSTECHNQDKVSLGTTAARQCLNMCELALRVAAIHLIALAQAIELRNPDNLGRALSDIHRTIRQIAPFYIRISKWTSTSTAHMTRSAVH